MQGKQQTESHALSQHPIAEGISAEAKGRRNVLRCVDVCLTTTPMFLVLASCVSLSYVGFIKVNSRLVGWLKQGVLTTVLHGPLVINC